MRSEAPRAPSGTSTSVASAHTGSPSGRSGLAHAKTAAPQRGARAAWASWENLGARTTARPDPAQDERGQAGERQREQADTMSTCSCVGVFAGWWVSARGTL